MLRDLDSDLLMNYEVVQYMYCHPENVILRKGKRKLLKWQHLMAKSNVMLTINFLKDNKTMHSIQVSQEIYVLEQLGPLPKYLSRSLIVTTMENWISFKWTTRKGNTQFQLELLNPTLVDQIAAALEDIGASVIRKPSSPKATHAHHLLLKKEPLPINHKEIDSQSTQVASNEGSFYLEAQLSTQGKWNTHDIQSQPQLQTQDETQVQTQCSKESSEFSVQMTNSIFDNCSKLDVRSITATSVRMLDQISLFNTGSKMSISTKNKLASLQNLNVEDIIKRKKSLHLSIETYSYASVKSRWNAEPLTWHHLGLASNICLSLISSDHNGEPVIILARGFDTLETFVPHPGYLRVYFTNEILALCQIGVGPQRPERYIQLHMKQANIAITCEWLRHWQIHAEDPLGINMETEDTTWNGRRAMGSEVSAISRGSRFWARRTQKSLDRYI